MADIVQNQAQSNAPDQDKNKVAPAVALLPQQPSKTEPMHTPEKKS